MAAHDRAQRIAIARSGAHRKRANDGLREARTAEAANYIRALVAEAPPLSELQRARLAALLLSGHRDDQVAAAG